MVQARTVEEVQAAVRAHARLRPVAGRTKTALCHGDGELLDLSALTGIVDFQPAECTFTALAGTRIAEIEALLAQHGLYLPFEPPFGDRGATLGGTVAAGLSGPGRLRYGGVRDFLLGVRFVDGEGRLLRGGGRVVKNAAGFSLQHLLLGSLGRLGVLVELTFKVFPRPAARLTLAVGAGTFARVLDALVRLRQSTFELDAAELSPDGTLLVRLAGAESALDARASELTGFLAQAGFLAPPEVTRLSANEGDAAWRAARELTWAGAAPLVKIAVTPGCIARLEDQLAQEQLRQQADVPRRYAAGGEVAWVGWTGSIEKLDERLRGIDLQGVVLTGDPVAAPLIGRPADDAFERRVRQALDPRGVFA